MHVHNDWMKIEDPKKRGGGFSTNITEALYDAYRKIEIKDVSVHAALEEGAYAWLLAGFTPYYGMPSGATDRMTHLMGEALQAGRLSDYAKLRSLLGRIGTRNAPHPREIALLQGELKSYPSKKGSLGKEIFAGLSWEGRRLIPTLGESVTKLEKMRERARLRRQGGGN
jgi:hypothetical protein